MIPECTEILIPDTNVFMSAVEALTGDRRGINTQNCIYNYAKSIVISEVVLAEFYGVWYHKNISFENYFICFCY